MNRRSLAILGGAVAVLAAIVAIIEIADTGGSRGRAADGGLWLGELADYANNLDNVRVSRPGAEPVTLAGGDSGWVVSSQHDYPADFSLLAGLVADLASAQILEEKTSNPDNYAALGVDDPATGGGATRIDLNAGDRTTSVLLGNSLRGEQRYVRAADDAVSYLVDKALDLPDDAAGWLDTAIVDLPRERIAGIVIEHADGERLELSRADAELPDLEFTNLPDGRELSYAGVGNSLGGTLAGLEFEAVRPVVDGNVATTTQITTTDGVTLAVAVTREDEEAWLAFAASAGDDAGAAAKAAAINARVAGWHYRVADYRLNQLTRRWDDVLADAAGD